MKKKKNRKWRATSILFTVSFGIQWHSWSTQNELISYKLQAYKNHLKGLGTFSNTKQNVHRFSLNLLGLKIMKVESFPKNITFWSAVVFEKWENNATKILMLNVFSWHCFTHFSQNYSTSAHNIFGEAFYSHYLQTV